MSYVNDTPKLVHRSTADLLVRRRVICPGRPEDTTRVTRIVFLSVY